jgi:hypothetical protein
MIVDLCEIGRPERDGHLWRVELQPTAFPRERRQSQRCSKVGVSQLTRINLINLSLLFEDQFPASTMAPTTIIVIGAGPSGISMAYTLKHKLGFDDFTVRKFPWNPLFHPRKALVSGLH